MDKKTTRGDLPTYDELAFALHDTNMLYIDALRSGRYFTHDITRLMGNESLLSRLVDNDYVFGLVRDLRLSEGAIIDTGIQPLAFIKCLCKVCGKEFYGNVEFDCCPSCYI